MNFAVALHGVGDDKGGEAPLWKVITDRPLASEAYEELYAIYQNAKNRAGQGVLNVWLTADPDSVAARQLELARPSSSDASPMQSTFTSNCCRDMMPIRLCSVASNSFLAKPGD